MGPTHHILRISTETIEAAYKAWVSDIGSDPETTDMARGRGNEGLRRVKDQIIEKRADSRGRVTLGSEFANKEVQLAVLEVEGED